MKPDIRCQFSLCFIRLCWSVVVHFLDLRKTFPNADPSPETDYYRQFIVICLFVFLEVGIRFYFTSSSIHWYRALLLCRLRTYILSVSCTISSNVYIYIYILPSIDENIYNETKKEKLSLWLKTWNYQLWYIYIYIYIWWMVLRYTWRSSSWQPRK